MAGAGDDIPLDSLSLEATGKPNQDAAAGDDIPLEATGKPYQDSNAVDDIPLDSLSLEETRKLNKDAVADELINVEAVTAGDTIYETANKFEELGLSPELLKGLYVEMKFEKPSKIQAVSLPMILTPPFKNMVAQAQNGAGKTTCFVLGMLSRVDPTLAAPQALCICPTRELAIQNMEVLLRMGKFTGITSELVVQPRQGDQSQNVRKRVAVTAQVVIGTPGTIESLFVYKKLSLRSMKILVFDEADHMFADNAFRDKSRNIMKFIGRGCQVLLFSATFNDVVKDFIDKTITELSDKDYNQMFVKKEQLSLASVKQYKVNCPDEKTKIEVVKDRILELANKVGQTIIFVRTTESANSMYNNLRELGYEVTTTHGKMPQERRDAVIKEFRDGLTSVLITTDLLARGFDQSQVNLVVNYHLPIVYGSVEPDFEVYMHRVGRAGRFGRKGAVFNLMATQAEKEVMRKIEEYYDYQVAEISDCKSDEAFEDALKKAGLM